MISAIRSALRSEIIPSSKVTMLGRAAGLDYARVGDREYLAEDALLEDPGDVAERSGQKFMSVPVLATDDEGRSLPVGNRYRRLLPVATGTYAAAHRTRGRTASTVRPVDALALPALAAKPSRVLGHSCRDAARAASGG